MKSIFLQVKTLLLGVRPKLYTQIFEIHTHGLSTRDRQLFPRHEFVLIDSHRLLTRFDTTLVPLKESDQVCGARSTSINMRSPSK
jgi:hypothetical protein